MFQSSLVDTIHSSHHDKMTLSHLPSPPSPAPRELVNMRSSPQMNSVELESKLELNHSKLNQESFSQFFSPQSLLDRSDFENHSERSLCLSNTATTAITANVSGKGVGPIRRRSGNKRKSAYPVRSINKSELLEMYTRTNGQILNKVDTLFHDRISPLGLLNLDVYSVYLQSPALLLNVQSTKRHSCPTLSASSGPSSGASQSSRKSSSSKKTAAVKTTVFTQAVKALSGKDDDSTCSSLESSKNLFRGQKALPEEIEAAKEIDLSRFKYTKGAPTVQWKGSPLDVPKDAEGYEDLTREEIQTCRILRILPAQYMHIKQVMLQQILKSHFKKRDAQAWFRIDVNKTNRLYDWFCSLGWIPEREEWEERIPQIFGF